MFGLSCPSCHVPDVVTKLYCNGGPAMVVLPRSPVTAVQAQLSNTSCLVPAVLSLVSWSDCPDLSFLSLLHYLDYSLWLSCPVFLSCYPVFNFLIVHHIKCNFQFFQTLKHE
jgi:hypothetical protein